jgi:hypothetical protein
MAFALSLFHKFGLFAPKADTTEIFGLRLTRLGTREQRRNVRASVFVRPLV